MKILKNKKQQNKFRYFVMSFMLVSVIYIGACKKEEAEVNEKQLEVIIDDKIPQNDEELSKDLSNLDLALNPIINEKSNGNGNLNQEVDQTPKEINKSIYLIEAYLNYKYDDSTSFELITKDTSLITIPAILENNKYVVDYNKFIEAYNKSEIETISHQEREKLRLTNPTVAIIDVELVTSEDPKIPTKDFVARVITVMGYKLIDCATSFQCQFDTDDHWKSSTVAGQNGKCNSTGTCNTSNASIELERKSNVCHKYGCQNQSFYVDVETIGSFGPSGISSGLYIGAAGTCLDPSSMMYNFNRIATNTSVFRPQGKQAFVFDVITDYCLCPITSNEFYRLSVTYGKCTSKRLLKKVFSQS